jgi:hypothetical protein
MLDFRPEVNPDIVYDIFPVGIAIAYKHDGKLIGIELNPEYTDMAIKRIESKTIEAILIC